MRHTSRITSTLSYALLMVLLIAAATARPAAARPGAQPPGPASLRGEPRAARAADTNPLAEAYKRGGLVSYGEPSELLLRSVARAKLGPAASERDVGVAADKLLIEWRQGHYTGPDPRAYQRLAKNEQRALASDSSPAALGQAITGTLRLFAVAVEFDGTDVVTDFVHPATVFGDRSCVTDTLTLSGPLHNEIPKPGPRDNNTFWVPSFERSYYENLIFSTEGITERVRPDLTDPEDGKPGIDVSGQTMRNYYDEVSGGRVQFDGGPEGVTAWVKVPHSEAYYGADACVDGQAGDIADMEGLPSNPRFGFGAPTLVEDVVKAINAANPSFPWADYDTNGDGIVDHVVLFHAGKDKSDGGGEQTWQALWAHRGSIDPGKGGYAVSDSGTPNDPSDDVKILNYTMQYENATVGVLVHEFGHDLGLPDLYNIQRDGETDVVWWDLMSTGSHPGKLFGTTPTHMSAWSKFALGWADPQVISATNSLQNVTLGQASRPPAGSTQAVRVNLPDAVITDTILLPGSTQAWWTNNDAAWADVRLTRDVDLTGATGPISVSFDLDGAAEQDWDYMFVEVSVDGGQTYTQTKGFQVGTYAELTTPDDYSDPNGRLHDYGDLVHGYTGDTGGWLRAYHDLSPYAGKNIKLRFRYATDAAFQERGYFVDNIKITSAGATLLDDPVEGGNLNGWTPEVRSFVIGETPSAGWVQTNGVRHLPRYYLLEWRNPTGFDKGLLYTYSTIFDVAQADGSEEWRVDKLPSNVPGMLVWLRDTRFGSDPFGANQAVLDPAQLVASPSEGPKAGLLVVDSHPNPLRAPITSTVDLGFGEFAYPPLSNWNARIQTLNAAFTLRDTPPLTLTLASGAISETTTVLTPTLYRALPAVQGYHDALGYFPGVEQLPEPIRTFSNTTTLRLKPYAFSDPDASVVVPARDYYPPRTPAGFTGAGAETSPPSANVSTFETLVLDVDSSTFNTINVGEAGGTNVVGQQSGNPGSYGAQYGDHFRLIGQAPDGTTATVRIWNSPFAADLSSSSSPAAGGRAVNVKVTAQNTGSPTPLTIYSDFDERQAAFVEGSATNGAILVRASREQVTAALRGQGLAGVRALAVAPGDATAVVWTSPSRLDTGATASFSYQLALRPGVTSTKPTNGAFGPSFAER